MPRETNVRNFGSFWDGGTSKTGAVLVGLLAVDYGGDGTLSFARDASTWLPFRYSCIIWVLAGPNICGRVRKFGGGDVKDKVERERTMEKEIPPNRGVRDRDTTGSRHALTLWLRAC